MGLRSQKKRSVFGFFIFSILANLGVGVVTAQPSKPANLTPIEIAKVVSTDMAPTMAAPGTVVSRNDSQIAAEVNGRINWIAEVGTKLQTGDTIAKIDDRSLKLTLAERDAEIAQLQARLAYNDRQLKRLQQLANQNSASKTQFDEITSGRNVVSHQLTSARAARDRTLYDLDRTEVKTPFAGQWVERLQQVGEYTKVGNSLGRLVDTLNKEVRVRAPIAVAPFVVSGMMLSVTGNKFKGSYPVRAIIPVGDEISRSLEIRVVIDVDSLLVGTAVRVAVPSANPERVTAVPRDALVIRQDMTFVFRLVDDVVEQVPVELGHADETHIAVKGALSSDDKVVVRGAERLRNGQGVKVLGMRTP